jgi:putative peptide zinc metalloprotease protein
MATWIAGVTEPAEWPILAKLKPTLAANVSIGERQVRGQRWAFLENTVSGRHLRLNASALQIVRQLDGNTSLQEIAADTEGQDGAVSAADLCACLAVFCQAGVVCLGADSDAERLFLLQQRSAAVARRHRWLNPLALRLPLHDPDAWLSKLLPYSRCLFTRASLYVVITLIGFAMVVGFIHAHEVSTELARVATSPRQWWLAGILYPCLKAMHELAHALCIKRWGGSVHEVGVTFLVLVPLPHVDASDAWLFPHRYQRMAVSAAGMLAESVIAALGLLLWSVIEPGVLRDFAFAAAVTGSVSTILFNANPLLKFDGYYLLQDWLDIPNMASRSSGYYRYLSRRYLLSVQAAVSPVTAAGERRWLLAYGASSLIYRWIITLAIVFFLAQKYLIIGVLLGSLALIHLALKPAWQVVHYLLQSAELVGHRARAGLASGTLVLSSLLLILLLPLPASTRAEGIVWVPGQARIFAAEAGEVAELVVRPGQMVKRGQLLMQLEQPALFTRRTVVAAEIQSLKFARQAVWQHDPAQARQLAADLTSLRQQAAALERQVEHLAVHATAAGRFAADDDQPLAGRLVAQGESLGYVVDPQALLVRAVISQAHLGQIQAGVTSVSVRLADDFGRVITATQFHQIPAGNFHLPSPSLANNGGGGIAVATGDSDELKTLERVFHVEVALPSDVTSAAIGGRAYVKMNHQPESLGRRWWRSLRQLLLKQLTV